MTHRFGGAAAVVGAIVLCAGCGAASPSASPSAPTESPTASPTAAPSITPTPTVTPSPTFPADARVRAVSLNVRMGPGVRHPAVGAIGDSTPVSLTGRDHEAGWFIVMAPDGTTGWASGDYMEFLVDRQAVPTAPTPTPPPTPSPAPPPMDPALPLVLDPPAAPQGGSVVVRLRAPGAAQVVAALDPLTVPLFPVDGERFAGVIPIDIARSTGRHTVQATAIGADGAPTVWSAELEVWPSHFSTETITLTEATMGLLDPVLRAQELAMLAGVWNEAGAERRWSTAWTVPVTGSVSSDFGGTRLYQPGNVPGAHTGIDLRGARGSAVVAAAAGRVVLAEPLTARGNTVVLDHGWGAYSVYLHLDEIVVTVGADVPAGAVVGVLGATGMATGPHLHFEVRVHGVAVDPRSWLRGVAVSIP